MSVKGQEQAAWVALTNDPSVYTSTRPREVFAHGYRAAYVDLHQQLVRANNEDAERYEAERAVLVEALREKDAAIKTLLAAAHLRQDNPRLSAADIAEIDANAEKVAVAALLGSRGRTYASGSPKRSTKQRWPTRRMAAGGQAGATSRANIYDEGEDQRPYYRALADAALAAARLPEQPDEGTEPRSRLRMLAHTRGVCPICAQAVPADEGITEAARKIVEGRVAQVLGGYVTRTHPGRDCVQTGHIYREWWEEAQADLTALRAALAARPTVPEEPA